MEQSKKKYLLSITIGPVQDFIATARRTRDLWFGSWLLSELSKAAAAKIGSDNLIFPSIDRVEKLSDDRFNAPNKILAIVEDPIILAGQINTAISEKLEIIWNKASKQITCGFDKATPWNQIAGMTEFYWAAVPYEGSNYSKLRDKVEYLLAARKATRNFDNVLWGSNIPKSSLDGQRESVIPEDVYKRLSENDLRKEYGVRKGERLCGVGLLKRHGGSDKRFQSTSHVAALPFLNRLETNDKAKEEAGKYITKLNKIGIDTGDLDTSPRRHPIFGYHDGRLLFEQRIREVFPGDENKQSVAKAALKEFLDAVEDSPSPYYAVLLADGDFMGKAIDEQKGPKDHRKLSKDLSDFAGSVNKIVDKNHQGCLIYAGGDDVLALVPLDTVLQCAKDLSAEFKETLKDYKYDDQRSPTLSVGIAVVHFMEPLQDALDFARQAEKAAKDVDGKDALAIIVNKRRGSPRTVKGKWGEIDKLLDELMTFDKNKDISRQAAYQLNDLSRRLETKLTGISDEDKKKLSEIKRAEAARIFKRKLQGSEDDGLIDALPGYAVEDFSNALIVAKEFNVSKGDAT